MATKLARSTSIGQGEHILHYLMAILLFFLFPPFPINLNINDRITMTEVECFDPLTNEWTLSKALPESRFLKKVYHKFDEIL